jgi:PKD repeat protein
MRQSSLRKHILIVGATLAVFAFLISVADKNRHAVLAALAQNTKGWAWSDMPDGSDELKAPGGLVGRGVGWISFNNRNCDNDDNGISDGNPGCPPSGTAMASYGVHVDPQTGAFSGQAWSEHIGWISFDRQNAGAPPGPPYNGSETFIARMDFATLKVHGWARALAACRDSLWDGVNFACTGAGAGDQAGGWDGWIKLSGAAVDGSPYGVTYGFGLGQLQGWAWGDRVMGWISFNCSNQAVCASSPYAVEAAIDTVPPTVSIDQPNGVIGIGSSFNVTLVAEDDLSGVVEGNVEVRLNGGGPWTKYDGNLFTTFTYEGVPGNRYEFRFQAKDAAGNWSEFITDGMLVINRPPNTPDPSSPEGGAAAFSVFPASPLTPVLSWSAFSDLDGAGAHDVPGSPPGGGHADADTQSGYHVQLAENPSFTTIVFERDISANSNAVTVDSGLRFDVSYFWRVRVRDEHDLFSSFGDALSGTNCRGVVGENCAFFTPPSSPPAAGFTYVPVAPSVIEPVRFTDTSVDSDDAFNCPRHAPPGPANGQCRIVAWLWDFGDSTTSTAQNPTHLYTAKGTYTVKLTVTDDDGQTNTVSRTIAVRPQLPDFKEVLPR